jgi:hypothetical protein
MAEPTKRMTAEECRSKAADCREMARVAFKPEHKIMLQHVAETWDRIATDVDNQKRDS